MDVPTMNGTQQPLANGIPTKPPVEQNGGRISQGPQGPKHTTPDEEHEHLEQGSHLANGVAAEEKHNKNAEQAVDRLDGLPIEVRQLTEHFRPFHKLVHRSVQQTWNEFSDVIDQLADIGIVSSQTAPNVKPQANGTLSGDQSPENLEKKDRLLRFQQDQRALFIKLLVLYEWYKKSRGIDHAIELSMWIHDQRNHFSQAADFIGNIKRDLVQWQITNPDLRTAVEVLSTGKVAAFSNLGYVPAKPLSSKRMLRTLQDINLLLCTRLTLEDQVPLSLSKYRVHDGRVTFVVPHEFELDVSLADEDQLSQFYFIDFRYLFLQRSTFLEGRLHDDFAAKINELLRTDGLAGCFDFLHDLTLSHKLNSLRRQAADFATKQWSENLRNELVNRTLVVQYWLKRPMPRSWIEIGLNSGRKKRRRDGMRWKGSFLDLCWVKEKNKNGDNYVDFDVAPLSIEHILHSVIARHSSSILEGIYENLLQCKLYTDGQLLLDLSCSDENPRDCCLEIQLTSQRHISLAIEPISGSLILRPASRLTGRIEFELNRLANPIAEGLPHLKSLRCLAAEQEIVQQAGMAGWEIMHTSLLSPSDVKSVFPSTTMKFALMRKASWQQNVMVAATFSTEGDNWWLLYSSGQSLSPSLAGLVSQPIESPVIHDDTDMDPMTFFSKLEEYSSGAITFGVSREEMRRMNLPHGLPALPRFQKDFHLPAMKVQYQPNLARRALATSISDTLSGDAHLESRKEDRTAKHDHDSSLIERTVYLKFCGLSRTSQNALILAKGKTRAPTKVLQSLAGLARSGFKVKPDMGEFVASFQIPIGVSFTTELFTRLQSFDILLSCLTIIKSFDSTRIESLSLTQIAFRYNEELELSASIGFPSGTAPITLQLLPEASNPHIRISHFIEHLLTDLRRPFTVNLGGVLSMLATTCPLLKVFDDLQKPREAPNPAAEETVPTPSPVRFHCFARSSTHYALQYFACPPNSRTMIARFEIFRHLRRDTFVWILRPALEETVSYLRSSFIDVTLKQRLMGEIFDVRAAEGYLGLDTGAACPIDSPGPLVMKVDTVVRSWANEALTDALARGELPKKALEEDGKEGSTKQLKKEPNTPPLSLPTQQQEQQQSAHPGRAGNGTGGPSRPTITLPRTAQPKQPKAKAVIDLD